MLPYFYDFRHSSVTIPPLQERATALCHQVESKSSTSKHTPKRKSTAQKGVPHANVLRITGDPLNLYLPRAAVYRRHRRHNQPH